MNWRTFVFGRLNASAPVKLDVLDGYIFGAGSLRGSPDKRPFLVIAFSSEFGEINDGDVPVVTSQLLTLWAHDDPGDYTRIDRVLRNSQLALQGPVVEQGGIFARWQGNSGDLADPTYGTIVRNSEYKLIGKVA